MMNTSTMTNDPSEIRAPHPHAPQCHRTDQTSEYLASNIVSQYHAKAWPNQGLRSHTRCHAKHHGDGERGAGIGWCFRTQGRARRFNSHIDAVLVSDAHRGVGVFREHDEKARVLATQVVHTKTKIDKNTFPVSEHPHQEQHGTKRTHIAHVQGAQMSYELLPLSSHGSFKRLRPNHSQTTQGQVPRRPRPCRTDDLSEDC